MSVRAGVAVAGGILMLAACSTDTSPTGSGNPAPADRTTAVATSAAPPTASPTAAAAGAPSVTALPVGPGPQKHYTVQAQPPVGTCHYRYEKGEPLEDPACTPGAISPAVTQATIGTTICRKGGYTGGIRPPESVTAKEKAANAKSYGYAGSLSDAEYDHLVSLQLGGDPNDPRNLFVEPPDPGHKPGTGVNNAKDPVETKLHTAVCSGKITLAQAQQAIATDWTTALTVLHLG
ncbi:hypothetical protein VSR01_28460 [Actinacidiphila sp. DG2A-62]|uniref:hypothetical protein n=1 Tax=Actinacidiphila sp. DG2A-62 TaxID=3108821 RepID=UPI002DBC9644|nr:hypothetical protein [Actinacidiphila sp. DG2A-62]MEC3997224.1 hypothetical protein [Actinacidiphila sp. DG2A-62]